MVPVVESCTKNTDQSEGNGILIVVCSWVRRWVLSGSRMPRTELMVLMTSMQLEVLGRCSKTLLRISGTPRILDILVCREESSSLVGSLL